MDFPKTSAKNWDVMNNVSLERDGATLVPAALTEAMCADLETRLADLPTDVAEVRIGSAPMLRRLLAGEGVIGRLAADVLGPKACPVRAVLFDKTAARNWSLAWHQDRTIVVERREGVAGFGPWTVKAGLVQVEPPFEVIERMVTIRVHLAPVSETNAPLRIVPGSHFLGRVPETEIADVVDRLGERICLAERGNAWVYATAIVHGSRAAEPPRRRRVLQIDYSGETLPEPLRWRGL